MTRNGIIPHLLIRLAIAAILFMAMGPVTSAQSYKVWDGSSEAKPEFINNGELFVIITSPAELAYVRNHWGDVISPYMPEDVYYYDVAYRLDADLDMTAASWKPMGSTRYKRKFDGNGHTIRIRIEDTSDNYEGLFETIADSGTVTNLHVDCFIKVGNARMVGGIAGNNYGTIENCWVSGHVESDHYHSSKDADLGGIVGLNESSGNVKYCCMIGDVKNTDGNSGVGGIAGSNEGTISHVTFYGSVSVDHSQDNIYVGDQDGTLNNNHSSFSQSEFNDAAGNDMYRKAIKYTYDLAFSTEGKGTAMYSAGGEDGVPGARSGQTVTVTRLTGRVERIDIKDADGNWVYSQGDINGTLSFTMPKKKVSIHVVFSSPEFLNHAGTEADPFIVKSTADWNDFAGVVNSGITLGGQFVKLTNNISIDQMVGTGDADSFQGTFDGEGHTLTFNVNTTENNTAPFRHVKNAVIKNLSVAGTITTSAKFAGGLVSESHGSLRLTNCLSSVNINSSKGGDGTHGGLVGELSGANNEIIIEGCVFDGSFATTNSTGNCGGFIGWPVYNKPTIRYSLMAPVSVDRGMLNNTFARWHTTFEPTIDKCFFVATENLPADQGFSAQVLTSAPDQLGGVVKDYGLVKAYAQAVQYNGKYYWANRLLPGSGTEADPYTISSTDDWDLFAELTRSGCLYTGKYVKLTSDISVTTMGGSFEGIFDGDGHTITVNYINRKNAALFQLVKNVTIKNLRTAGRIESNQFETMAGVAIEAEGTTFFENCISSVYIHADGFIGGFVSLYNDNTDITFSGCAFTGNIAFRGGNISLFNAAGGLGGLAASTVSAHFIDCLFAPSPEMKISRNIFGGNIIFGPFVAVSPIGKYSIQNSYYTESFGNDQGAKAVVFETAPANLGELVKDYGMLQVYQNGLSCDGKYYVGALLDLDDKTDNGQSISDLNGTTVNVTLTGCTLYKDGSWNTICLPFNLTLAGSPLEGAVARPLSNAAVSGSTLNLTFGDAVTELKAGTPYFIKWASGENIVNPEFRGVTIDATDRSYDNGAKGDARVRFIGVYKSIAFDTEDKSVLLLGGSNALYSPIAGAGVGALHAYFKIGDSATKATVMVNESVLTFKGE